MTFSALLSRHWRSDTRHEIPVSEHDKTLLPELIRDLIKERRASRRLKLLKYSFWGTGLLLVAGAVMVEHLQLDEADEAKQITAVIQVRGEIADGAEANAAALKKAIGRAFDDERAKAVVLKNQLARRQPGTGRPGVRRDQSPARPASESAGLRRH